MKLLTKVFLVFGFVVLLGLILLMFQAIQNTNEKKYTFQTSQQTVIQELRKLNRLETAVFTIEKVIDAKTSGNRIKQLLFGDRILLIAYGEVIAGFDLSRLSEDAVAISGSNLSITLPAPQLLVSRLDNDQTRVYDRRLGFLTKGDPNLETAARSEAESVIKNAACNGGILTEATKNAKSQLTALFRTLNFSNVEVVIPQGNC